ncbi:MAG: autotransporter assembly complex family protein [Pseudomonadota bacterium]
MFSGRVATHRAIVALLGSLLVASSAAAELLIDGATTAQAQNIRLLSRINKLDCGAPPWLVRLRFSTLAPEAERALQGLGFYQATLNTALSFEKPCWEARVTVVPGPAVRVGRVTVELQGDGQSDARLLAATQSDELAVGQPFSHTAYRQLKRRLAAVAAERGYFDGEYTVARVAVDRATNLVAIELRYATGQRYRFGELVVTQSLVDDSLIARFIDWQPDAPYDAATLAQLTNRLQSSGYFDRVSVEPRIPDVYAPVDVFASAEGSGKARYSIGAGYSSDIGPRLRTGVEDRRVNSRGHQFNGDLSVSPVLSSLAAEYRRPLRDPTIEWLSYTVAAQEEDTNTAETQSFTLGLRRVKRLNGGWLRADSLRYEVSEFKVGDIDDRARLLMPSVGFSREWSDDAINPSQGYRLSVRARGAAEELGSTTSFAQLLGDWKWITSFGPNTRLLARAAVGLTFEDDFNELPPTVRFFAGGNESIRGFGFDTLGPRDADGIVIGGSQLLTASLELERTLRGSIAGAVFVDAGNAFDGTEVDARVAVGLGLKWRSPVGPLRLYIAKPTNFDQRDIRLHVSFGPDL